MEDAAEMHSLCLPGTFRENCEDLLLIDQGFCKPVNAKADLEDVVLERPDATRSGCCSLRNRVFPPKASAVRDLGSHMAAALSVGLSPAPQPCPMPSPLSWYCCLSLWCTVLPTLPRALEPAWVFREENSRKQVIDKAIFYFVINIWNTVSKLHLKVYCKENLNVPCK